MYEMEDKGDKLKVRFVKNLKLHAKAICCYWIDEIHVDESLQKSPALNSIIKHETKHYEIIQRIITTKSHLKRLLLALYNNVWDILSCMKISVKYFKCEFILYYFFPIATFTIIYLHSLKVI